MTHEIRIRSLNVRYPGGAHALRDLDLELPSSGVTVIVGESGSGKSTLLFAILGLLPHATRVTGSIVVGELDVVGACEATMRSLRGRTIGFVPQNPFHAVDPLRPVRRHVMDAARAHGLRLSPQDVATRLASLGITSTHAAGDHYAHEWSGGMLQRACIAAAVVHRPPIVLADEPTSALDAGTGETVLNAIVASAASTVIVTHDIDLAMRAADRIVVLYAGRVVEVLEPSGRPVRPGHPYTEALIESVPVHGVLPVGLDGTPPALTEPDPGCAFAARCGRRTAGCAHRPALVDGVRCHHPLDARHAR